MTEDQAPSSASAETIHAHFERSGETIEVNVIVESHASRILALESGADLTEGKFYLPGDLVRGVMRAERPQDLPALRKALRRAPDLTVKSTHGGARRSGPDRVQVDLPVSKEIWDDLQRESEATGESRNVAAGRRVERAIANGMLPNISPGGRLVLRLRSDIYGDLRSQAEDQGCTTKALIRRILQPEE